MDGISLTVVEWDESSFTVSVVRYTQDNTNLGVRKPGDVVNLEVDILAKYAEKLPGGSSMTWRAWAGAGLSVDQPSSIWRGDNGSD